MPLIHKFQGNSFEDNFSDLSGKMGAGIIDNTINIPPQLGAGFIKNIMLEENFCVRYFNISFKSDTELELFTDQPDPEDIYTLLFNLDSNKPSGNTDDPFHQNPSDVLLWSAHFMKKGIIKNNEGFRRVAIIFNADWLMKNHEEAGRKIKDLTEGMGTKNKSAILSENLDTQNRFIITQLANEMDRKTFAGIRIKTASFILLNDFLNKIVQRGRQDILSNQTLHYYTIIKVEEKIVQSINQKLPNLDKLAAEFNLSLSTLKRHFRVVFGKNIYQYYQEKRMEWGKKQLEKGESSIGEIATQLGFYKINNFSIAFKKYFGILPKELKHRSFIHINN